MLVADFAVIGGGIAGVSLAAYLAPYGATVVLEREAELAKHSTGRSIAAYLQSYGSPEIQELTRFSGQYIDAAGKESDTNLLHRRPLLWVANSSQIGGLDRFLEDTPLARRITVAEAVAMFPALRPSYIRGAAVEDNASDLDAIGLHTYYVGTLKRNHGKILSQTALTSGRFTAGKWMLYTTKETIAAAIVVNAAGAWADEVALSLGANPVGLQPTKRTVAICRAKDIDRNWPMVIDLDERFYVRPDPEGILISPADETEHQAAEPKPDELDIAQAIERVNAATTLDLRSVKHAWAGLRTFTKDRLPVIGFDTGQSGLFWLAGNGGFGIQAAPAMALLALSLIVPKTAHSLAPRNIDVRVFNPERFANLKQ